MKQQLYAYCMQGDVQKAYQYLLALEKNKSAERLIKKYYNRFFSNPPILRYKSKDPWIRKVVKVYYEYFILVLTKTADAKKAEKGLINRLNDCIRESLHDLDLIEEVLEKEFKKRGYYFLGGVTSPYRGPYIWAKQEKADYNVMLPSGNQKVTVYFLTDFILKSWLDFATFGQVGTGGWATKDALYCVKERYEKVLDKPTFLYSYLAHEAQHFSDYEKFPHLGGRDLEYRAKLVELIYHPSNQSLMKAFALNAKCDRSNPHTYADYVLCSHLSRRVMDLDFCDDPSVWEAVEQDRISHIALELFQEHTQLLVSHGSEIVESVI